MNAVNTKGNLIEKPNLQAAKTVTIVTMFFLVLGIVVYLSSSNSWLYSIQIYRYTIDYICMAATLLMLGIYMCNFNTKLVSYLTYFIFAVTIISEIAAYFTNDDWGYTLKSAYLFVIFSTIKIVYIIIGIRLVTLKNDYVGGLKLVGSMLIAVGSFNIAGRILDIIVIPILFEYIDVEYLFIKIYSIGKQVVNFLLEMTLLISILLVFIKAQQYNESIETGRGE